MNFPLLSFIFSDSDREDQNVVLVKEGGVVSLKQVKKKETTKAKDKMEEEETSKPIGEFIYHQIWTET